MSLEVVEEVSALKEGSVDALRFRLLAIAVKSKLVQQKQRRSVACEEFIPIYNPAACRAWMSSSMCLSWSEAVQNFI